MPIERASITARLSVPYLLDLPGDGPPPVILVACHGYASNPADLFHLARAAAGPRPAVASIQGPHPHYLRFPDLKSPVVYSWGTWEQGHDLVRLHHEILHGTIGDLRARLELPATPVVLIGHSQPVSLNYRFAATYPGVVQGVIGVCGGVPSDWEDSPIYRDTGAAILHISRDRDEFFPLDKVNAYESRLRLRSNDVTFRLLPGGHGFPSAANEIVQPWLQSRFPGL